MSDQRSKTTRRSQGAREAILQAAGEAFARHGFSGARIDAIAEAAGYNKSLIFQYFQSKENLYRAVIDLVKGDINEDIAFVSNSCQHDHPLTYEGVRTFLTLSVAHAFNVLTKHDLLRRMLVWEAAENWQTFTSDDVFYGSMAKNMQFMREYLNRAQQAGLVKPEYDVVTMMALVIATGFGYLNSLPRFNTLFPDVDFFSEASIARARQHVTDLILAGVMSPPPRS